MTGRQIVNTYVSLTDGHGFFVIRDVQADEGRLRGGLQQEVGGPAKGLLSPDPAQTRHTVPALLAWCPLDRKSVV